MRYLISMSILTEPCIVSSQSEKLPEFIDTFFNKLFSKEFENDSIRTESIMKAFWTFRDLVFDVRNAPNSNQMYDVLFEKLKTISEMKFVLSKDQQRDLDNELENYYWDLMTDFMRDKYSPEDAFDMSSQQESWSFSTF